MAARSSMVAIGESVEDNIETILGHSFRRKELLQQALTHSSYTNESDPPGADALPGSGAASQHNEQMEFLGDAVLGFVVSAQLVERFPEASEGRLSKIKAHLVSASHLYDVAARIRLGQFLRLGKGEEKNGGRGKRALLVDAMEAVIAALYLDGGVAAAGGFVVRHVVGALDADPQAVPVDDPKTALQELAQSLQLTQPLYRVVEERGPGHRKIFMVEVRLGDQRVAAAEGETKKRAQQAAARAALAVLRR